MLKDRQEAGRLLARKLDEEELITHPATSVVLGITRGGIVLARVIANHFDIELDVIIVKKLSAPGQPELAIGAIGETRGSRYIDQKIVDGLKISKDYLKQEINHKLAEIKRREKVYRQGKKAIPLKDKDVIITDDGTATGATMVAAAREVWNYEPRRVIIALPVAPQDTLGKLEEEADSVIILKTPEPFFAVGQFYQHFPQLNDKEVLKYINGKSRA